MMTSSSRDCAVVVTPTVLAALRHPAEDTEM